MTTGEREGAARDGADLILTSGRVLTMDDADTVVSAVAVRRGRIVAVGSDADIGPLIGSDSLVVPLEGRTALPGFIDAHAHLELGARAGRIWSDIKGLSRRETLSVVEQLVREQPPGRWIVAQATHGQDLPTRKELDSVAPSHPVALRWNMHRLVANSAALAASGIDRRFAAPPGSRVVRDASGEPTGELEEGFDLLATSPVEKADLERALHESMVEEFVSRGVTTVCELPASATAVSCYQDMHREKRLPLRLTLNLTVAPGHQPIAELEQLVGLGLQSGFGDEWLRLGAVKIFADGYGEAAAWFRQTQERPAQWGLVTRTYQRLARDVVTATGGGLQVWIHAVGDAAQEMAIDAIAEARRAYPELRLRHRIEHIGNEHLDLTQLERLRSAAAIPVPTAAFMHGAPADHPSLPSPRYAFRTLIDAGFRPPGNSDSAGSQPFALNPLHGVWCMVARRNGRGEPVCPDEAISVREALRAYTRDAAHAAHLEESRGSIEVGKLADIVVLSRDPLAVARDELGRISAVLTVLDGNVAFAASGWRERLSSHNLTMG